MATREHVVNVCDGCGAEGDAVHTHTLAIDKKSVEVEACGRCFTKIETAVLPFMQAGRRLKRAS